MTRALNTEWRSLESAIHGEIFNISRENREA